MFHKTVRLKWSIVLDHDETIAMNHIPLVKTAFQLIFLMLRTCYWEGAHILLSSNKDILSRKEEIQRKLRSYRDVNPGPLDPYSKAMPLKPALNGSFAFRNLLKKTKS